MMEQIKKVWFDKDRIYILNTNGIEKSRPLEAFPRLKDASEQQRNNHIIWAEGQSIRWDEIDEDIHISSFSETTEPNYDNAVARMFDSIGVIDVAAFSKMIGMKKSKLDLFRYGIWSPCDATLQKITEGLRQIQYRIASAL